MYRLFSSVDRDSFDDGRPTQSLDPVDAVIGLATLRVPQAGVYDGVLIQLHSFGLLQILF